MFEHLILPLGILLLAVWVAIESESLKATLLTFFGAILVVGIAQGALGV